MQASSERTPPVEWSQIMTTAGVQAGDYVTCEWLVCMSICVHYVYLCVCVCVVQAGDYVTCEWLVCMSICVHYVYLCVCVACKQGTT